MASNVKIGTAARNGGCDGIVDLVDAGGGAGYLEIRTGAPPATPATADSGTLLATCPMAATAFGDSAVGIATAAGITSDTDAAATGTAGHFRLKDNAGVVILQGTAGEAADSADMTFDNKTIVDGGTIAVTAMTVTVPEQ